MAGGIGTMMNRIKLLVIQRKKTSATLFVIAVILLYLFLSGKHSSEKQKMSQWLTISPKPAVIAVHKYGKIVTAHNFSVTAPFDGTILQIFYGLGDNVTKGQKLLVLSTDKAIKKLHDAKSDYLKKEADYQKYLNWEKSSDVQKARQSLLNAQQQIKISQEKLNDDKFLYKAGIISRDELDQQQQTVVQNQQQIDSQKLSLADTLQQGDADNLLIKKLSVEDAKTTLDTLTKQIAQATIIAPASGVALKPTQTGGKDSGSFKAVQGETVTENQNLLTIGNAQHLEVQGSLNQEEINSIEVNTPVEITSDAFPSVTLKGKIDSISRLADDSSSSSPTFPFTVELENITAKERKLMRVGLMVDISLETYKNDSALVVPISAIYTSNAGKDYVLIKGKSNKPIKRFITRGPALPDGVVIKQGLKAGDQVQVMM